MDIRELFAVIVLNNARFHGQRAVKYVSTSQTADQVYAPYDIREYPVYVRL